MKVFNHFLQKIMLLMLIMIFLFAGNLFGQRLTGVNWFGFETGSYVTHGLWSRDYKGMLQQIKDLGFNCIRLPWCVQMLDKSPGGIQINEYNPDPYTGVMGMNMDLSGLTSLQVMDKIMTEAQNLGLKILLDCHSLAADGYSAEPLWYTSSYSESAWISAWTTMANRYKSYSCVVGADLKNEPHGNLGTGQKPPATWGYTAAGYSNTDWKAAAERCGKAINGVASGWLIVIEGVEQAQDGDYYWWGGNLKDVNNYKISGVSNVVYSFHEYGSGVYMQPWFSASDYPNNMPGIWDTHFYFIQKQGIGRLLLGEFGIKESEAANSGSIDYKWLTKLMSYLGGTVDWTFWCINPNSGDTGGILKDDWVSVNTAKYNILKPYLAGGGGGSTNPPASTTAPTTPPTDTPAPTNPPADTSAPADTPAPTNPPADTAAPTDTPGPTAIPTATPAGTPIPTNPPTDTSAPADTQAPTNPPSDTTPPATGCTCTNLCSSQTSITVPFTKDGAGEFCYVSSSLATYVNSWNTDAVNVNGTNCTNTYVSSSSIAAIGGQYYIYYKGSYSWAHMEIK
jgi:endoglucanase